MAGKKKDVALPVPVERFFNAVGRDEMIQALQASEDPRIAQTVRLLMDVRPITVVEACRKTKTTMADLVDAFHKYQVNEGTVRMMRHIPKVMEDVAEDAKSKSEPCMRCDSHGCVPMPEDSPLILEEQPEWVPPGWRVCPQCHGRKEVRVPGDKLARELVFEAVGLTGKKAPAVAIQQNFGQPNSIEQSTLMTQKLLVKGNVN